MAYIQERKTDDGKVHYRVQIRLRGFPVETATFDRKTDAKLWAQNTEAEMRAGRYFKTAEAKKHTVADLVDRYFALQGQGPFQHKAFKVIAGAPHYHQSHQEVSTELALWRQHREAVQKMRSA